MLFSEINLFHYHEDRRIIVPNPNHVELEEKLEKKKNAFLICKKSFVIVNYANKHSHLKTYKYSTLMKG